MLCAHYTWCWSCLRQSVQRHRTEDTCRYTETAEGLCGWKVFTSPSTSVHTLAQIALAKLLSPSHAAHSIYLYNEYTAWMEVQGRDHTGFKGFVENQLGRIAEIAQEYLAQRQSTLDFFEAVVDVNSNKLVLAVSMYIQNNWFLCCSKVYKVFGEIIIFPLMHLLGIDKHDSSNFERTWNGVRQFFAAKLPNYNRKWKNVPLQPLAKNGCMLPSQKR